MRPIIFRGNKLNKWYYGAISFGPLGAIFIEYADGFHVEVDRHTVGQFTGLNALDGTPIYEGDIVRIRFLSDDETGVVVYENGCFMLDGVTGNDILCDYDVITVLGNIHDNPELIKKGDL